MCLVGTLRCGVRTVEQFDAFAIKERDVSNIRTPFPDKFALVARAFVGAHHLPQKAGAGSRERGLVDQRAAICDHADRLRSPRGDSH